MQATILNVRLYGDPVLRKKSEPIKEVGPVERMLIQSMLATMHEHKGIGLAAPQVGINQRILVADIGDGPIVVINPEIIKRKGSSKMEEGCLSIPGVMVNIKRPEKIVVKHLNEKNQVVERVYDDLLARVILHETDHLNGKLIIDYAPLIQKAKIRKKLKELTKAVEAASKTKN